MTDAILSEPWLDAGERQELAQPILPTATTNPAAPAINSHGLPLTASKMPKDNTAPIPTHTAIA